MRQSTRRRYIVPGGRDSHAFPCVCWMQLSRCWMQGSRAVSVLALREGQVIFAALTRAHCCLLLRHSSGQCGTLQNSGSWQHSCCYCRHCPSCCCCNEFYEPLAAIQCQELFLYSLQHYHDIFSYCLQYFVLETITMLTKIL